jgi:diadenosine tetraphosphate (Ap4A) HIT family hydrolase
MTESSRVDLTAYPVLRGYPSIVTAASCGVFAIRYAYPVTPLHTLVLPRRHIATYVDLSCREAMAIDELLGRFREHIVADDGTAERLQRRHQY